MRNYLALPACFAVSLLVTACATQTNPNFEQAQQNVSDLQNHPDARQYAAIETQDAVTKLEEAEKALNKGADQSKVDHLSYLADRQAELARQTIVLRTAEEAFERLPEERARTRLQARDQEIEQLREQLNAKDTERGSVVTFESVLFDVNKADLKPAANTTIRTLADFLKDNPQRKILVEGFTDNTGSDAYNLELSQARADSVRHALVREGVEPSRIDTVGLGKAHPVSGNDSPASRAMNRRVEVTISHDEREVPSR
ncbi:OmpA family protein [Pseudomonas sp. gcc21]|uniref:OmpA family protein n=1 Tax=Pseudomonas sp. gcc21 TaxID=2726989 RepID=UPI001452525F|nr:OmpA family protein [Pseudomonas sp. gcc21]QJD58294.1 OmpA family protein [Pseudomonas sp. gcc21]